MPRCYGCTVGNLLSVGINSKIFCGYQNPWVIKYWFLEKMEPSILQGLWNWYYPKCVKQNWEGAWVWASQLCALLIQLSQSSASCLPSIHWEHVFSRKLWTPERFPLVSSTLEYHFTHFGKRTNRVTSSYCTLQCGVIKAVLSVTKGWVKKIHIHFIVSNLLHYNPCIYCIWHTQKQFSWCH